MHTHFQGVVLKKRSDMHKNTASQQLQLYKNFYTSVLKISSIIER